MRIAIVGGGFSGFATAYWLYHHSKGTVSIDIFDPKPVGFGVSGLSAGLLHPYPGKRAEKMANSETLLDATHALITEASQGLRRPCVISRGILRPAITPLQIEAFKKTATTYNDVEWWEREKCLKAIPGLQITDKEGGGLFIKSGVTLDVKAYLEGLWQIGIRFGLDFIQKPITSAEDLASYNAVVLASGMHVKEVLPSLPLAPVKGQSLRLKWPTNLPPLPFSLISEGYITMDKEQKSCIVGATFERQFKDDKPDVKEASKWIRERIAPFFPALLNAPVEEVYAGIRATSLRHSLPLLGRVHEKYWFITGLGSKGLLYHGFLAQTLASAILSNDPNLLPKEYVFS